MVTVFKHYSLKTKTTVAIMLTTLIVLVIITSFTAMNNWQNSKSNANKQLIATSKIHALDIENKLHNYSTLSRNAGEVLKSLKSQKLTNRNISINILKDLLISHRELIGLWTIWEPNEWDAQDSIYRNSQQFDDTGRFVVYVNFKDTKAFVDKLIDYEVPGEGDYYLIPKQRKKDTLLDPFIYRIRNVETLMTSIVTPIFIDEKFVGVTGIDISLSEVQKQIDKIKPYSSSHAYLISHSGAYLSHPDNTKISKQSYVGKRHEKIRELLESKKDFSIIVKDDHANEQLYTGTLISLANSQESWYLLIKTPTTEILSGAKLLLIKQIAIGALGLITILLVIISLAKLITLKLNTIINGLKIETKMITHSSEEVVVRTHATSETSIQLSINLQEISSSIKELSIIVSKNSQLTSSLVTSSRHSANATLKAMDISQNMIDTIHEITNDDGSANIDLAVLTSDKCAEALEDILENASNVNELIKQISSINNEESEVLIEINKIISELALITQASTASARESSLSPSELMNQVMRLNEMIEDLEHLIRGQK